MVSTAFACVSVPEEILLRGVTRWSKVPWAVAPTITILSLSSPSFFPFMMSAMERFSNVWSLPR